jgi:hypothetical protein
VGPHPVGRDHRRVVVALVLLATRHRDGGADEGQAEQSGAHVSRAPFGATRSPHR